MEPPSALHDAERPRSALALAVSLSAAAAEVGFDWPSPAPVFDAVREELDELSEAVNETDEAAVRHELGDVLLAACNLARHLGVPPEAALRAATQRFEDRFRLMESTAHAERAALHAMGPDELEQRWQAAKRTIRAGGGA